MVVDIDGTLAKVDPRRRLLEATPVDWDAFYRDSFDDEPIPEICRMVCELAKSYEVVSCTSRRETVRRATQLWLRRIPPCPRAYGTYIAQGTYMVHPSRRVSGSYMVHRVSRQRPFSFCPDFLFLPVFSYLCPAIRRNPPVASRPVSPVGSSVRLSADGRSVVQRSSVVVRSTVAICRRGTMQNRAAAGTERQTSYANYLTKNTKHITILVTP